MKPLRRCVLGPVAHALLSCSVLLHCGGSVSVEFTIGDPTTPGKSDPPYDDSETFPSGLQLHLVSDAALTASYPRPESNPFGSSRIRHYNRVGFFIDLARAPLAGRVSEDFRVSEYVNPTLARGGRRAYLDAEIAHHIQRIRSGLGRPLIVNSAFRSPEHNDAVGGASYSRHLYGDGVDIDVDQLNSNADVRAQEVFNEAMDVGVDFVAPLIETSVTVGGEPRVSWVHLDDRGF